MIECVIVHGILNTCCKYYIYYFILYYIDVFIFPYDNWKIINLFTLM